MLHFQDVPTGFENVSGRRRGINSNQRRLVRLEEIGDWRRLEEISQRHDEEQENLMMGEQHNEVTITLNTV